MYSNLLNETMNHPILLFFFKAIGCAIITVLTARMISNYMINLAIQAEGSDAGRAVFAWLCHETLEFMVPIGLLNALILSPYIARNLEMDPNYVSIILCNVKAFVMLIVMIPFLCIISVSVPFIDGFRILFYSPFIIPPLIVGSLFYSLCKVTQLLKLN